MTTKLETYTARAAESLAAANAATTERDRAFHRRANGIWKKLMAGSGAGDTITVEAPVAKPKSAKAAIGTKPAKRS